MATEIGSYRFIIAYFWRFDQFRSMQDTFRCPKPSQTLNQKITTINLPIAGCTQNFSACLSSHPKYVILIRPKRNFLLRFYSFDFCVLIQQKLSPRRSTDDDYGAV